MKNRVDLVNKELHSKFFENIDPPLEKEQYHYQQHHNLSSQILIKSLIKKGLSTSTNSFKYRSRTVKHSLPQMKGSKSNLKILQKANILRENEQKQTNKNVKSKYGITLSAGVEVLIEKPAEKFEEFDEIINKLQFQRMHEAQRRKIKLERYNKNKFATWRKSCVHTQGN